MSKTRWYLKFCDLENKIGIKGQIVHRNDRLNIPSTQYRNQRNGAQKS